MAKILFWLVIALLVLAAMSVAVALLGAMFAALPFVLGAFVLFLILCMLVGDK